MTPEFELVNSILGYGDCGSPERRGVWLVGVEEADGYGKTVDEVRRRYADVEKCLVNHFVIEGDGEGKKFRGQIEQYISKILCVFSPETHINFNTVSASKSLSWEQAETWGFYRKKLLWHQGAGICNANLFPLGKAETRMWPEEHLGVYGFSRNALGQYKEYVRSTRFVHIRDCWKKCQPQATICYVGESYQKEVDILFQLKAKEWHRLPVDCNVLCHEEMKILLTPHFSRRPWSNLMAGVVQRQ